MPLSAIIIGKKAIRELIKMDTYITAKTIKRLREERGLTQSQLAFHIGVSDKAVSKWETSKGLPDISLIEPLG